MLETLYGGGARYPYPTYPNLPVDYGSPVGVNELGTAAGAGGLDTQLDVGHGDCVYGYYRGDQ